VLPKKGSAASRGALLMAPPCRRVRGPRQGRLPEQTLPLRKRGVGSIYVRAIFSIA
jgi:hypothetical protein